MYHKKQSLGGGGGVSDDAVVEVCCPGTVPRPGGMAQHEVAHRSSSANLGTPLLAHFSQSLVILPFSLFISCFSSVLSFLLFIFIVLSVFFLYMFLLFFSLIVFHSLFPLILPSQLFLSPSIAFTLSGLLPFYLSP
jgi:hypothetical protein